MRGVGADAGRMSSPEQVHHSGHNGVAQAAPQAPSSVDVRREGASRAAAQVPSWSLQSLERPLSVILGLDPRIEPSAADRRPPEAPGLPPDPRVKPEDDGS